MKLVPIEAKGCDNLYRNPKTQIIYFKIFRKDRGEFHRSTRTHVLAEARMIADDFRKEFLGISRIKKGRKLCGELFDPWIERKAIKARPSTISSIKLSWSHLRPFIENMLPEDITAEWWESVYVPEKRKPTVSNSGKTIDNSGRKFFNDRKWLSMFLIQLKRDGVLEKIPTLIDVDPPRAPGKVYSDDEVASLLQNAGVDLKLQILMGVTMGMRIGEIMGMTLDRIDFEKRTMHLRAQDTKTKKPRTFGISEPVWEMIEALELEYGPGAPLFANPEASDRPQGRQGNKTAWTTCKRLAEVTGRFHWLRHSFLTRAFKQSTNPALICHYAGLSLEEAERTYLHFTPEDTRVVSTLVRFD